jgi:hypothetical protein
MVGDNRSKNLIDKLVPDAGNVSGVTKNGYTALSFLFFDMHDDSAGFEERRRWIQMRNPETFYLNVCALFVLMFLLLVCQR